MKASMTIEKLENGFVLKTYRQEGRFFSLDKKDKLMESISDIIDKWQVEKEEESEEE